MAPWKAFSIISGVKSASFRWCSRDSMARMLFSACPVRFGMIVASPTVILPSGRKSLVNMGVLVLAFSGQKGQFVLVFSISVFSSSVFVVRNLLMYACIPGMTVVLRSVSGSVLYSKVIVSSWKFLSGLRILVCLMVFSNVIMAVRSS